MKKAKLFSLLLAGIVCIAAAAGCSPGGSSSGTQTNSGTEGDPSVSSEPVNIVWYRYGFNASGDYASAVNNVSEQLNEYLKEKINVTVEMQCFSGKEYGTKLSLAMASRQPVDLFWTGSTYSMNTPRELVKDGSVYDLTELVKNNEKLYGYMPESIWDVSKYDDKIYFVPNFKDMGNGAGIMFNGELVKKTNFDVSKVKKLADLEPYLEAIKDECQAPCMISGTSSFSTGIFNTFTQNNPYIYSVFATGQIAFDRNTNKVINVIETDEYEETVNTLRDFNQKGYIPSWMATDTDSSKQNECVKTNDYGVRNAGVYPDYESFWKATYGFEGKYLQLSDILLDRDGALGSAYAVPVYSTKAEAAVKFLDLLETDKTVGDFALYGVKDKNYQVDPDGSVTKIADSGYSFPAYAVNSLLNASLLKGQEPSFYESVKKFVEDETVSPLFGFSFDSSKVDAELAAIKEVASGYSLLNTGDMDVDKVLPEYRGALKEAGIDRVIEEAQRQIDEYLQSK